MNIIRLKGLFSICHQKRPIDQGLRLLMKSNLDSLVPLLDNCGQRTLQYLIKCYTQAKIQNNDYLEELVRNYVQRGADENTFEVYRDIIQHKDQLSSRYFNLVQEKIDLTQITNKQLEQCQKLPRFQSMLANISIPIDNNENLSQLLKRPVPQDWKVEFISRDPQIVVIKNKLKTYLIYGNFDKASLQDFSITLDLISHLNQKPHFLIETQPKPIVEKEVEEYLNIDRSFSDALKLGSDMVSYQTVIQGSDFYSLVHSQILNTEISRIRNGIVFYKEAFPQVNVIGTLVLQAAQYYKSVKTATSMSCVEVPSSLLNINTICSRSLPHLQNVIQICNHLTLMEKLRFINDLNSNKVPCYKCSPDISGLDYQLPKNYLSIISNDDKLIGTKFESEYALSLGKEILQSITKLKGEFYRLCVLAPIQAIPKWNPI